MCRLLYMVSLLVLCACVSSHSTNSNEHIQTATTPSLKQVDKDSIAFDSTLQNSSLTGTIGFEELVLPASSKDDQLIHHIGYTLSYVEQAEQAEWVAYVLTSAEVSGSYKRSDHFVEDPLVKTGSASSRDYKGSGLDRGHLAPAADMKWSSRAMEESFYFSNMSPQEPSFNRGIWKRLEEQVRNWAISFDSICVVTGPILTGSLETIGYNEVAVPAYYYKVVLAQTPHGLSAIGFLLPNKGSSEELNAFAVTVDQVEKVSGIDFFYQAEDADETKIEATIQWNDWVISHSDRTSSSNNSYQSPDTRSVSVQCSGLTKKGKRCKNKTLSLDGRCYLHH